MLSRQDAAESANDRPNHERRRLDNTAVTDDFNLVESSMHSEFGYPTLEILTFQNRFANAHGNGAETIATSPNPSATNDPISAKIFDIVRQIGAPEISLGDFENNCEYGGESSESETEQNSNTENYAESFEVHHNQHWKNAHQTESSGSFWDEEFRKYLMEASSIVSSHSVPTSIMATKPEVNSHSNAISEDIKSGLNTLKKSPHDIGSLFDDAKLDSLLVKLTENPEYFTFPGATQCDEISPKESHPSQLLNQFDQAASESRTLETIRVAFHTKNSATFTGKLSGSFCQKISCIDDSRIEKSVVTETLTFAHNRTITRIPFRSNYGAERKIMDQISEQQHHKFLSTIQQDDDDLMATRRILKSASQKIIAENLKAETELEKLKIFENIENDYISLRSSSRSLLGADEPPRKDRKKKHRKAKRKQKVELKAKSTEENINSGSDQETAETMAKTATSTVFSPVSKSIPTYFTLDISVKIIGNHFWMPLLDFIGSSCLVHEFREMIDDNVRRISLSLQTEKSSTEYSFIETVRKCFENYDSLRVEIWESFQPLERPKVSMSKILLPSPEDSLYPQFGDEIFFIMVKTDVLSRFFEELSQDVDFAVLAAKNIHQLGANESKFFVSTHPGADGFYQELSDIQLSGPWCALVLNGHQIQFYILNLVRNGKFGDGFDLMVTEDAHLSFQRAKLFFEACEISNAPYKHGEQQIENAIIFIKDTHASIVADVVEFLDSKDVILQDLRLSVDKNINNLFKMSSHKKFFFAALLVCGPALREQLKSLPATNLHTRIVFGGDSVEIDTCFKEFNISIFPSPCLKIHPPKQKDLPYFIESIVSDPLDDLHPVQFAKRPVSFLMVLPFAFVGSDHRSMLDVLRRILRGLRSLRIRCFNLVRIDEQKAAKLLENRGITAESADYTEMIEKLISGPLICITVDRCDSERFFDSPEEQWVKKTILKPLYEMNDIRHEVGLIFGTVN